MTKKFLTLAAALLFCRAACAAPIEVTAEPHSHYFWSAVPAYFAAIAKNTGPSPATNCRALPIDGWPGNFTAYALSGTTIPAGASGVWLIEISATPQLTAEVIGAPFEAENLAVTVACDQGAAQIVEGLNTVDIGVYAAPGPDVIMEAAPRIITVSPNGWTAFAVAATNVGVYYKPGAIPGAPLSDPNGVVLYANGSDNWQPGMLSFGGDICETAVDGTCLTGFLSPSTYKEMYGGNAVTMAVYIQTTKPLPAGPHLFTIHAEDMDGNNRGSVRVWLQNAVTQK